MSGRSGLPSQALPLIPQYFSGREVFITGATGFMGKVLVERLLWTCPDISRLHLLMRHKRGVSPEKRLNELKECQVFDVIREKCPERLEKLSVVAGDVTKQNFDMNGEDIQELSKVTVVFHSAATIRFDEPLAAAVQQNVRSVVTLMDVCDQLPSIQVLIYVSTAYSNSDISCVEERVYPAPANLEQLLIWTDTLPENILADITPKLISPKPNTYTFTKAMAESVVAARARTAHYAAAIFRPSIVVSSLQHPFPGWVDSLNSASGLVVGVGKGVCHVLPCEGPNRADLIPVDIVIDTLIAIAWETGINSSRETRVYNCSSYDNPITWEQFKVTVLHSLQKNPFNYPLWYPFVLFVINRPLLRIAEWILQTVPLHTGNALCTLFRVKQRIKLTTICDRLHAISSSFKYFTKREWQFSTNNTRRLKDRLTAADAALYNLDVQSIDWETHTFDFVKGLRRYLLRESEEELTRARARMRLLYSIHRLTQCLIIFFTYRLATRLTPYIHQTVAVAMENVRKRM